MAWVVAVGFLFIGICILLYSEHMDCKRSKRLKDGECIDFTSLIRKR